MAIDFRVEKSNTQEILNELHNRIPITLEMMGLQGETNAVLEITKLGAVDTGNLRNSITHAISESDSAAVIGTNVEYGKYVELGTSRMKARPFLQNAIINNVDEYKKICEQVFGSE